MIGRRMVLPLVIAGSVAVGGIAGAVLGVPGLSSASTTNSPKNAASPNAPAGKRGAAVLDAVAKALNMTTADLKQQLSDGKTTIADIAKQRNVDINTVIDAIVGVARSRAEQFVNNPLPQRRHGDGPGIGRGVKPMFGAAYDAAAKAVGISTDELKSEMRSGKTVAQIAKDHNVDVNTVISQTVDALSKQIDQAVTDKKLTAEQASALKNNLTKMVTNLVDGSFRGGFGGFFGPGMHGPRGGGAPKAQYAPMN